MKLNLFGNMPLILPRDPQSAMEAATKNYVDRTMSTHAENVALHLTTAQNAWLDAITVTAEEVNAIAGLSGNVVEQLALKLDKAGGTMTGALHLSGDPVDPTQAATKNYVDTKDALKVNKAGDSMSGFLTLHANPETNMQAAPKQYVDATVAAHTSNTDLHVPANQVDFLKTSTITGAEANSLLGVTGNVQTQLNAKLDKSGGTLTGPLVLPGAPTENLQAATKQYVDQEAAKKLNLTGGTLIGPLVLSGAPATADQAANKQYVDSSLQTHAADEALHLTAAQNTLLDGLTVTHTDINRLSGVTGNVQTQLDTKFDKAGGTVSGDITLAEGKAVFVSKAPATDSELVNKAYVDFLIQGQEWRDPVSGINLVSTTTSAPPAEPVESDIYIVGAAATGAWAGKEGYATVFVEGAWRFLQERAVQVGDRFGVALRSETAVTAELTAHAKTLVTVTNATVGAMAFTSDPNSAGSTTLVFDEDAPDFGVSYSFNDAGNWVPTNTSVNLTTGDGLKLQGSTLNVNIGKGLELNGDNQVQVSVAPDLALKTQADQLTLTTDGVTLVQTGGVLAMSPAAVAAIGNAVTKTGTSDVTGTIAVQVGGKVTLADAPVAATDATNKQYVDSKASGLQTSVEGLDGRLQALETDPVTKQYVDQEDAKKLDKAGGTLTGPLQLSGDPASALHATPKQYVDSTLKAHADSTELHLTPDQNTLLDGLTVTHTELNRVAGATSNIQDQLNDRLPLGGGTMTGPITLSGAPLAAAHAATKGYVDGEVGQKVAKAGDTMTGFLVLHADPSAAMHPATKQYADSNLAAHVNSDLVHMTPDQNAFLDAVTVTAEEVNQLAGITVNVQDTLNGKLDKAGGTMTGVLTLSGAPAANLHAATKQYVDSNTTNKLPLAGGTMTGSLILSGAPVADAEAATKKYVDDALSGAGGDLSAQINNRVAKAGDTMTGFLTLHSAPTQDLHAATKKFVDDSVSALSASVDADLQVTDQNVAALRTDVDGLLADPVTKNYVDTQDAARVSKSGATMTGFLTLHSDPQSPMHAVPKQYVDAVAQGLKTKPAVRLATTENLVGTYNNGTAGVNATLTASANGALVADGVTPMVGDRVLLRMQTNKLENGDYVVQQVGNAATPFVLKRVVTADESAEIPGAYFYTYDGVTLKGTGWALVVDNPVTFGIGVDDIMVNQFSGQGSLIAGDGMKLTGNTLDIIAADPTRITVNADSIDLTPTGITPGAYTKVTVDGYGRVLTATNPTTLAGYGINDAQPKSTLLTNLAGVSTKGILVLDAGGQATTRQLEVLGIGLSVSNKDGGTGDITITSNATDAATAGTVVARDASGNFSANTITAAVNGNASSATVLKDSRNFSISGDVVADPEAFNGAGNVVLATQLTATGVTAGSYTKVTVDAKGRVSLGENPTTVAGYGIIDAATIEYVNSKIADLEARMDALHLYVTSRM